MAEKVSAVSIKVKVGGSELEKAGVLSFSVTHQANSVSWANLSLVDGDVASMKFLHSSNPDLAPGKEIEIEIGHSTETKPIFKGIIVRHQIQVNGRTGSQLNLEIKHKAVKMTHVRNTKHFLEKKDSDIISTLVSDHGLSADVDADTTTEHERMIQYNISDWDFMVLRAEASGKLVHTYEDKVTVATPKIKGGGPKATYGTNIYSFEAETEARDQYKAGKAIAWDHSSQALIEQEAEAPSNAAPAGKPDGATMAGALGAAEFKLRHSGELPDTELTAWASAALLRSTLSKTRGRVQLLGDASIKPGDSITLEGLGDSFNGDAFVSGVRHHVHNGLWLTDIELGIDEACYMALRPQVVEPPVSGLLSPMRGLHIGVVKEVKDDPAGFFRAQVKLQVIDDPEDGIWCRISHADAGAGHSVFFMPQVGDEVVVGFLHEDPRHAIIIGRLHNSDANKPAIEDNDEYKKSGIFTVEKLSFIFNDEDKSVILETPAGKKIIVDEKEDTIRLEDDHNNKIEMNKDGITIESGKDVIIKATGDVKIDGVNIEQAASAQFKAEGSAGIEVSSSAIAVLKGSLVQIN
jgi:Rhs element Vgr protein